MARQIGVIQHAVKNVFDNDPVVNTDIIRKLAEYLDTSGTTDVRDLRLNLDQTQNLSFFFDSKTAHVFDNYYGADAKDLSYKAIYDNDRDNFIANHQFFAAQTEGDDYRILCTFTRDNFPVFFAVKTARSNSWNDALHALVFMTSIVIAVVVPALGAEIGSAVMGAELAAEYPALATMIGNVAVSTALNGGDVQAAVVSALAGGAGSFVGAGVSSATDSAIIGRAASAATSATIVGGNISGAVLQSLAASGVSSLSNLSTFQPVTQGNNMPLADSWAMEPPAPLPADYSYPTMDPTYTDYGGGSYSDPGTIGTVGYHDPVWSPDGSAAGASVPMPNANVPPSGPSGVVTSVNGATITQLALTGLRLVSSWNQAGQPNVRTSNAQVSARPNGMLVSANGQSRQMPPGTPYLTASNTLVTNNGDGTYTTVSAGGGITTSHYAQGGGGFSLGGIPPIALYGGAALVALLLLTGGSRHAR